MTETVSMDDLVEQEDLFYKKFTDVPFSGQVKSEWNGEIRESTKKGKWTTYYENGQLKEKGHYKDGKLIDWFYPPQPVRTSELSPPPTNFNYSSYSSVITE